MADRLTIKHAAIIEGPYFEQRTPDGEELAPRCFYFVEAYVDGDDCAYAHPHSFDEASDAEPFLERVLAGMTIDPECWSARVMYGTRTWVADGYEERQIEDEREGLS